MLNSEAQVTIDRLSMRLELGDVKPGSKAIVGYLVYDSSKNSSQEVTDALSQAMTKRSLTSSIIPANTLTALELFGNDDTSGVNCRIIEGFDEISFLSKDEVLPNLARIGEINEYLREAKKAYSKIKVDIVLGSLHDALDVADRLLTKFTTHSEEIKQNLFQILSFRSTKFNVTRVAYNESEINQYLIDSGFKMTQSQKPLCNLHIASFAYQYTSRMVSYRSFSQPTIMVVNKDLLAYIRAYADLKSRFLDDCNLGINYLFDEALSIPNVASLEEFTRWINLY